MFQIIRREILLLVIIAVAAVPMYLLTRRVADRNRTRNANTAAYWYQHGLQQMREGKWEATIASLRQASTNDRDNPRFAFALAQALAATNRDDEARLALLRLRESAPENPQINLELARLAARSRDLPQAVQYYHHAIYGFWTGEEIDEQRRQVRLELIHLLIDHKERSKALAELFVLSSEVPPVAAAHLQLAQLFRKAGDPTRALQHFAEAARLDVKNVAALSGAGEIAFELGDYKTAKSYLSEAVHLDKDAGRAADLLDITRLIESSDPLAARLSRGEQVSRLKAALEQAMRRLQQCLAANGRSDAARESLEIAASTVMNGVTTKNLREDPELLRTGAELVFDIEEKTSLACGEPAGLDEALLLVGRKHGAG